MKDRIDPLILERAPWLAHGSLLARMARLTFERALKYDRTLQLAEAFEPMDAMTIMAHMRHLLCQRVTVDGGWHIPKRGAALIVANHPTGIADAVMLSAALQPVRGDAFYYANSDILRALPQMSDVIAPVEWRPERRSRESLRATMAYTRRAVDDGRLGVIFPSGRLAKRRGLTLRERPWMNSAAMIARKFDLPIIPVNIQARNSILFYLLDLLHPTVRDITLFYETLNKANTPFHITIGPAISAADLPATSDAATDVLRDMTLSLAQGRANPTQRPKTQKPRLGFGGWARIS